MISKALFESIKNEWQSWLSTFVIMGLALVFESHQKGIKYAIGVITAVIMFVVMVIVISDIIIFIFNRHKPNKYWLALLSLCFLYYLLLHSLNKDNAFINLMEYSFAISIVLLIMIKLRFLFDKNN